MAHKGKPRTSTEKVSISEKKKEKCYLQCEQLNCILGRTVDTVSSSDLPQTPVQDVVEIMK